MVKPKLTILDVTALVLTILAAIVHIIGCFIPNWYTYESFNGEHVVIGMIKSTGCDRFKRCDRDIVKIDGGKGMSSFQRDFANQKLYTTTMYMLSSMKYLFAFSLYSLY